MAAVAASTTNSSIPRSLSGYVGAMMTTTFVGMQATSTARVCLFLFITASRVIRLHHHRHHCFCPLFWIPSGAHVARNSTTQLRFGQARERKKAHKAGKNQQESKRIVPGSINRCRVISTSRMMMIVMVCSSGVFRLLLMFASQ